MDPGRLAQSAARFARHRLSRRAALGSGGAGLAAALLGRAGPAALRPGRPGGHARRRRRSPGRTCRPNVPAWMQTPGAPSSPYGERAPAEESVVRLAPNPVVSFSPLADLHGTLTPNALFYEIHYGGIPAIDPTEHRLLVHGLVERPTLFTMDDLKRFPAVSRDPLPGVRGQLLLRSGRRPRWAPTVQLSHGLTSCAEWTGVPVATVLREVGIKPGGAWMLAEGADAAGHDRSIPIEKAMPDGLLVYAANGEDLRPSQGYPAAPAAARLRGQHERQVAAPPRRSATSPGTPGRRPPTTPT